MSPGGASHVPNDVDAFEQIAGPLAEDHWQETAAALAAFADARDDVEAWPHWRAIERGWLYLSGPHRRAMKVVAWRLLESVPDGERRRAVIDRLED